MIFRGEINNKYSKNFLENVKKWIFHKILDSFQDK